MSNDNVSSRQSAEMFFDPRCPWAWMTSRWLMEVERVRPVDVTWSVMSLAILNEDNESDSDPRGKDSGWGPVRVIMHAAAEHGDQVIKPLYDAMGERIHQQGRSRELAAVIDESLVEVGLPVELAQVAETSQVDDALRASHGRALELVGDEVGTPVVSVAGTAFFGPVVTPAPKGESAGKLWDGCLLVASTPGFYELKRSRDRGPDFS